MCLILFAYRPDAPQTLIVAANRDEFYQRPTAPMSRWPTPPGILAGRDLQAGGTWLGVGNDGRFAALTNVRGPGETREGAPSRGLLVSDFLSGDHGAREYLDDLRERAHEYSGFNLLVRDPSGLFYLSNRGASEPLLVPAGVHGLSNHLLDTPWPKVERGRRLLHELLSAGAEPEPDQLLDLLSDCALPGDEELPDTGVGIELERRLAPMFIQSPAYGTRSSTALILDSQGHGLIAERTHATPGNHVGVLHFRV